MQSGHGLPTHPSLPIAPHLRQQSSQGAPHYAAVFPAQASYPQLQQGVSSHYAQAYLQFNYPAPQQASWNNHSSGGHAYGQQASTSQLQLPNPAISRWYQPGSVRCTKSGCPFTGSKKAVETHMMDRHLIFPPGWEHRKRKDDWDADPSLKGKPIPIQGTTLKLDTPEQIEQWIAERKKRFPTADRVADKQQKLSEAAARGQLAFTNNRFPNKRRRLDTDIRYPADGPGNRRGQSWPRGRGQRGFGRGSASRHPYGRPGSSAAPSTREVLSTPANSIIVDARPAEDERTEESDSDSPPEIVSSKPPSGLDATSADQPVVESEGIPQKMEIRPAKKPQPKQPRRPPPNPYASRPALLRNLLLPEIRTTVSNLSQAIRFLVDNGFLDNVELKPGEADQKMIEVINDNGDGSNDLCQEHSP